MGSLSDGRLEGRAPQELMTLAGWLLDELDPAGVADPWPGSAQGAGEEFPGSAGDESSADASSRSPLGTPADPAADSSANPSTAISYELLELAVQQEWMIRSMQAKRIKTLAQAVRAMPPARRGGRTRRSNGPNGREPDASESAEDATETGTCISSVRLTSARMAPEMNCHPRTATTLLEHAQGLVDDLPTIMKLFSQARLDQTRAIIVTRMMHQAAEEIDDFEPGCDRWQMTEALIASQAPGLTSRDLERLIERLLLQLKPDAGTQAHEEARRSRHVGFEALADGMALITALVPADIAQLLHGFLDAAADAARDSAREKGITDPRTHHQRCADALAELVQAVTNGMPIPLAEEAKSSADAKAETGTSTSTGTGTAELTDSESFSSAEPTPDSVIRAWQQILALNGGTSRKTLLNITVTDASLLGLDNTPGLLQGHGPIAAGLARRLGVRPAQVNLIILPGACTHPEAHNLRHQPDQGEGSSSAEPCPAGLDHSLPGISRYRPGQALSNMLTSLYPTCVFPGCTTPATRCDLDHLRPFGLGGMSCLCNMRPACRPHHRLKTFGGWSARASRPDEPYPFGSTIWTTPDGVQHHTPPPCLPGMPGWSFPAANPEPPPERLVTADLMPVEDRTARRTRRWQNDLNWWKGRKERVRQETQRRARENPPPLARPRHAPWGQSEGRVAGLGDPPF